MILSDWGERKHTRVDDKNNDKVTIFFLRRRQFQMTFGDIKPKQDFVLLKRIGHDD